MPRGVYIRTERYRKNMAKAMTGRKWSKEAIDRNREQWIKNLGSSIWLGRPQTQETKEKLRKINKGRYLGLRHSPKTEFKKGQHPSPETEFKKGDPRVTGENCNFWKHGKSYTKEYIRRMKKRRTAFERGGGKLTTATVQLVYEDNIKKHGTLTCIYCSKPIEFGKDTLEHKIPLSRGGTNEYNNLAIACRHCNSSKQDLTEEEFRKKGGGAAPLA